MEKIKNKYIDYNLFMDIKSVITQNLKTYHIKTKSRSSTIFPCFLNLTIYVYNGKKYLPLRINKNYIGHKLGEFIYTRSLGQHKGKNKPVTIKKRGKGSIYSNYFDNCKYKNNFLLKKELFFNK